MPLSLISEDHASPNEIHGLKLLKTYCHSSAIPWLYCGWEERAEENLISTTKSLAQSNHHMKTYTVEIPMTTLSRPPLYFVALEGTEALSRFLFTLFLRHKYHQRAGLC